MERADTSRDGLIDEGEFVAFLSRMTVRDSDETFARRMDFLAAAIARAGAKTQARGFPFLAFFWDARMPTYSTALYVCPSGVSPCRKVELGQDSIPVLVWVRPVS